MDIDAWLCLYIGGSFSSGVGLLASGVGLISGRFGLMLIRTIWLFDYIGAPFCVCPL